jgi:predicted dinucleotide-binding enzyme
MQIAITGLGRIGAGMARYISKAVPPISPKISSFINTSK